MELSLPSVLPTDPAPPAATGCGQFLFPLWVWTVWASFLLPFQRLWDLHGRREIPAGGLLRVLGCLEHRRAPGQGSAAPHCRAQHPAATALQGKRKQLIPLPPFLHSKQLESGTAHGSAALAQLPLNSHYLCLWCRVHLHFAKLPLFYLALIRSV